MKANFLVYCFLFLAVADGGAAQESYAQYELGRTVYDLHGYYVSTNPQNPHFLAVFSDTDNLQLDPTEFDFEGACTAVNASPPVHPKIPKTNTVLQHGVVFVKTIEQRFFGLSSTVTSSFVEFDVVDGVCIKTQTPGEIYVPRPGFVP